MTSSPDHAPDSTKLDRNLLRVAAAVVIGAFMSIIDLTIVNVGLERIGTDLGTRDITDVQWVITAYMLSVAAVIPLTGWLSTRFGGRRVFLASILLFTISSALCALAHTLGALIAFRVLQGIAGGTIMPAGQMLLAREAGPHRMGRVMAIIGVPALMAPILGPVIGGVILKFTTWPWLFIVNVPVGIIGLFLSMRLLPGDGLSSTDRRTNSGSIDWLGVALTAVGLPFVVYGLANIAAHGNDWNYVSGPIACGLLLSAAFVVRCLRVSNPLINVRLWNNSGFSAAATTSFFLGASLFGSIILLPLYYQMVRGESPLITGLLLAPQGLGAAIGIATSGRLTDRIGGGPVTIVGLLITAAATIPFCLIDATSSYTWLSIVMLIRGVGFGATMMPTMAAAYAALTRDDVPHVTPQLNVMQRVGGSLGTAILATVLQHRFTHIPGLQVHADTEGVRHAGGALPPQIAAQMADAFGTAFWWTTVGSIVTLIPAYVLLRAERRRRQLRDQQPHGPLRVSPDHAPAEEPV